MMMMMMMMMIIIIIIIIIITRIRQEVQIALEATENFISSHLPVSVHWDPVQPLIPRSLDHETTEIGI